MIEYEIDIQGDELYVTVKSPEDGVTLRYRQRGDKWERIQDRWQCFYHRIRRELSSATVTAMLLSQNATPAVNGPLTIELVAAWEREYHTNREMVRQRW